MYTGTVGTHLDSDGNSDSLFELGWFKEDKNWIPLVVDGNKGNDGTRYVNSKKGKNHVNVEAIIGVYQQ